MKTVSAQPEKNNVLTGEDNSPVERSMIDNIWNVSQLGKIEETFELFGHKFTMHVLTEAEIIESYSRSAMYDGTKASNLAFRLQCISASLDFVDSDPIYVPISVNEDAHKKKTDIIMNWYPTVIDALYDKYVELTKKSDEIVRAEKK